MVLLQALCKAQSVVVQLWPNTASFPDPDDFAMTWTLTLKGENRDNGRKSTGVCLNTFALSPRVC